jgi:hypothetical protein
MIKMPATGLDPRIHVFVPGAKTWMAGTLGCPPRKRGGDPQSDPFRRICGRSQGDRAQRLPARGRGRVPRLGMTSQ